MKIAIFRVDNGFRRNMQCNTTCAIGLVRARIEDISWKAFEAVARYGNFAKASKALRIPVPALSKRVSKLEDQIGVRLFQRSTRVVSLTDEGIALLPKIRSILESLMEVESSFSPKRELSGIVKITCVPFIAHNLLVPIIGEFQSQHPKIKIDLSLGEKFVNIIESNIDMAIRIQTPDDSDLIYRKLIPNELIFCASPKYLKKNRARIENPQDLNNHNLLFLKIHEDCKFVSSKMRMKTFSQAKTIESDSGAFLTDLALNDYGILLRSIWDVQNHLKENRLVQVLKSHSVETFGHIHVVIPSKKYLAPRVRAFYEFILEKSKGWKHE